jgi:Ca2+-binding EF-hand superfamily protein
MVRLGLVVGIALTWVPVARAQAVDKGAKAPPAAQFLMQAGTDTFLKRFDKNKDGVLSRDEVPPFLTKLFDKVDTNQDGKLDRKELDHLRQRLLQQFGGQGQASQKAVGKAKGQQAAAAFPDFDALDKNADGRLTPEELKGTPYASRFQEIDTNRDGQIDRAEFEAFLARQAKQASK